MTMPFIATRRRADPLAELRCNVRIAESNVERAKEVPELRRAVMRLEAAERALVKAGGAV
jgi:hypothetical protein